MGAYILRRLLATFPVLVVVAVFTFSIIHLVPGDAASLLAGDEATPEDIERIRREFGLDRPFLVQFGSWAGGLLTGDLGRSIFTGHSVAQMMRHRVEPTVMLSISALLVAVSLGLTLGVLAGWKAHTLVDRVVMIFAVLGFSIPGFWLGFLLIWLFGVNLGWFPVLGYTSIFESVPGFFKSIALPSLTIGTSAAALIARMTRSSMLEVMGDDYIRTARSKGVPEYTVLLRHALKAASLPVITVIGLLVAGLLTGVVVTEIVFTIPGLGRMLIEAVSRRDLPVIQAVMILAATIYVFVNLLTDIAYAYLDPRVKY